MHLECNPSPQVELALTYTMKKYTTKNVHGVYANPTTHEGKKDV